MQYRNCNGNNLDIVAFNCGYGYTPTIISFFRPPLVRYVNFIAHLEAQRLLLECLQASVSGRIQSDWLPSYCTFLVSIDIAPLLLAAFQFRVWLIRSCSLYHPTLVKCHVSSGQDQYDLTGSHSTAIYFKHVKRPGIPAPSQYPCPLQVHRTELPIE